VTSVGEADRVGARGQEALVGLQEPAERTLRPRVLRRLGVVSTQAALLAAFLAAWQWVPEIHALSSRSHLFDRFFISSPSLVATRLYHMLFGIGYEGKDPIWTYTWNTVSASLVGVGIGMVAGALFGLVLGSSRITAEILRPFMVALNAVPRVALIPVVMIVFGPTFTGSTTVSVMVTFFIAFFNAYEGARTVTPQLIQNAKILGASRTRTMLYIRLPYVMAWTIAALPLAATFGITAVVFGELLIGSPGLGRELGVATSNVDSTFTFALAVMLTVIALLIVGTAELITRRVLHWWGK
jgi:NitT/TauT family transport system permease protein